MSTSGLHASRHLWEGTTLGRVWYRWRASRVPRQELGPEIDNDRGATYNRTGDRFIERVDTGIAASRSMNFK